MSKPLIPIALGLVFAAIAAFMTLGYLKGASTVVTEEVGIETRMVTVATAPIARGAILEADQLKLVEWPSSSIPEGVFFSAEDAIGKVARTSIYANDPVTRQKLLESDSRSALSVLIPRGRRAMSIKVNEVTGISGFVAPGSRVDVLLSLPGNEDEAARTRTVLQDLEVLAIAQSVEQRDNRPTVVNTVTLSVRPHDAEALTLAANEGSLHLSLRNDKDSANVYSVGTSIDQLIGTKSLSSNGPKIEVIRGAERDFATF